MDIIPRKRIFLLLVSILFLAYIVIFKSFFLRKEYWKNLLFNKTEEIIGYKINYTGDQISLFPYPFVLLENLNINNKTENFSLSIHSKRTTVYFSWTNILLNKWKIDKFEFEDSKIEISITSNKDSLSTSTLDIPEKLKNLQISSTSLKNVFIKFIINSKEDTVLINSFVFNHSSLNKNKLEINLDYLGGNIIADFNVGIDNSYKSIDDIQFSGTAYIKNFPIKIFQPFYKILANSNFSNSSANGELIFNKGINSEIEVSTKLNIANLNFINLSFLSPNIEINSTMTYFPKKNKLIFIKTYIKQGNILHANFSGELSFNSIIYLQLDIISEYFELEKSLQYILSFTKTNSNYNSNSKFESDIKLQCKKISYKDYNFGESKATIRIDNKIVLLNIEKATLHESLISGDGIIDSTNSTTYDLTFRIENLEIPLLIQKYTDKKFISGKLDTDFHLHSIGNDYSEIEKNLKIRGYANIKDGKLFGYANFLKPIFALGKLVNFLGPKGENSEFKTVQTHFYIENKIIDIPDFKMVGVGIDAAGKGKISFDSSIDLRLTVGFGGIAGKALSVPIIYKGLLNKNDAFIDPLWLGSVYLGITLAGPVGVTAGGIAGSMATEYIHNGIATIKDFFTFTNKELSQEKKEK